MVSMYIRTVIGIQLHKNRSTFGKVTCPFVFVLCCRSCPCRAVWTGGSSRLLCSSSPSSRCLVVFRTTSSCLPSPSTAASTAAWCCVILGRLSVDTASARAALTSCLGWATSNFQSLLHVLSRYHVVIIMKKIFSELMTYCILSSI